MSFSFVALEAKHITSTLNGIKGGEFSLEHASDKMCREMPVGHIMFRVHWYFVI